MARNRLTWTGNRKASAPPATPGYGTEDQSHPAHKPDPDMHDYENGDTSSWAEDPRKGPYPQGNPPATPGYDTEDQDHPAHKEAPRFPKEARVALERKASKCARIVEAVCGCGDESLMEDQALTLMDLPEEQLDTTIDTIDRLGGGFMAAEDDLEDIVGDEPKLALEDVMEKLAEITEELEGLKAGRKYADQNDPEGPTLKPETKTEEEVRNEAAEKDPLVAEFDSYDTAKVGFLYKKEWQGSRAVFASLDTDRDGIIARADLVKMALDDEEDEDEDNSEMAAKKAADEDEDDEDGSETASKKAADEEEEDDDDDDDGSETASKKAADEEDEIELEEDDSETASKKAADEDKDPMGLAEGDDEDEEVKKLAAVLFAADEEADELKKDAEDEDLFKEKKSAKKASVSKQRPQPRKPNHGLKTIGNLARVASAADKDLGNLWETAPDINKHLT